MSTYNEKRREATRAAFLIALAEHGNYTAAAKAAGVDRITIWHWRKDAAFEQECEGALEAFGDKLMHEAYRRAVSGVDEPVIYKGVPSYQFERDAMGRVVMVDGEPKLLLDANGAPRILTTKTYSDQLLALALKANVPKFRDNTKLELSGALDLNTMSDEDMRAELAALVAAGIVPTVVDDGSDLA